LALLESEGKAEDLLDERWQDEEYRAKHLDHVIDVLKDWSKEHTADELFELGQLMRLPWAPIRSPQEILSSTQLRSRGFFIDCEHPELGSVLSYPGLPFRFRPRYSMPRKKAPSPGEDNVRVYQGEVGLTDRELGSLAHKKII